MRTIFAATFGCFVLGLVAGCSDSGPVPEFTVTVTPQVAATGRFVLVNSVLIYQCDFPLSVAAAGGKPGYHLIWAGGTRSLQLKTNGQMVTTFIGQSDQKTWFGSNTVVTGQVVNGTPNFQMAGPFSGTLVMNYSRLNDESFSIDDRASTTQLDCR